MSKFNIGDRIRTTNVINSKGVITKEIKQYSFESYMIRIGTCLYTSMKAEDMELDYDYYKEFRVGDRVIINTDDHQDLKAVVATVSRDGIYVVEFNEFSPFYMDYYKGSMVLEFNEMELDDVYYRERRLEELFDLEEI